MAIQDVWLWEMEMCCDMQLEALRNKVGEYRGKQLAPGTIIDSSMRACPIDETLFEGLDFHIQVLENGSLEVVGRVLYWHPTDGGWDKIVSLKIFATWEACIQWLQDENCASRRECARILKEKGR